MNLPKKLDIEIGASPNDRVLALAINEIVDFIEEAERCCTCRGCPRHPKEQTLAQKFQEFRTKHGQGSGKEYWKGLERIAEEHNKSL